MHGYLSHSYISSMWCVYTLAARIWPGHHSFLPVPQLSIPVVALSAIGYCVHLRMDYTTCFKPLCCDNSTLLFGLQLSYPS